MWRRLFASQLKSLATTTTRSVATTGSLPFIASGSTASIFKISRHYSLEASEDAASVKKIQDIVPIATGHELEELETELQETPAIVKSYYDKRIIGCPGGEGEDEHDVVWFWLEKGKSDECPVCSQYFVLEVVGPGGPPDGHGDDDHHH